MQGPFSAQHSKLPRAGFILRPSMEIPQSSWLRSAPSPTFHTGLKLYRLLTATFKYLKSSIPSSSPSLPCSQKRLCLNADQSLN